jgi:hypothetical protein
MCPYSVNNFIKLFLQNFVDYKKNYLFSIILFFSLIVIFLLNGLKSYFSLYYLLFSITSIFFFVNSFFLSSLFTQKFIGLFLFLGFWVKFNFTIFFNNGRFAEYVNKLNPFGGGLVSGDEHDLLKNFYISSSLFLLTITFASKCLFNLNHISKKLNFFNLFAFAKFFKGKNFFLFIFFFIILVNFNFKYLFFMRGVIPTIENIFIIGFYKCFFSYVLLILAALLLDFYIRKNVNYLEIFVILLFFLFLNQIFIFSRLAPVLMLPIFFSLMHYVFTNKKNFIKNKQILFIILLSIFLSYLSFYVVYELRFALFFSKIDPNVPAGEFLNLIFESAAKENFEKIYNGDKWTMLRGFFIDRWVGADGLLSVINYITESGYYSYTYSVKSLQAMIITGPAGFFFKSGSYIIFFLLTFLSVFLISNIENLFKNLYKNLYFFQYVSAFILAYEFVHIGAGTIKIFFYYASIIFFILFIYFFFSFRKKNKL